MICIEIVSTKNKESSFCKTDSVEATKLTFKSIEILLGDLISVDLSCKEPLLLLV